LEELCLHAEQRGWVVPDGRAAEFERYVPFGLIVDALNDYIGGLEPALLLALDDDALSSRNINREVPAALFLIHAGRARLWSRATQIPRDPTVPRPVSESASTIMSTRCDHTVGAVTRGTAARRAARL